MWTPETQPYIDTFISLKHRAGLALLAHLSAELYAYIVCERFLTWNYECFVNPILLTHDQTCQALTFFFFLPGFQGKRLRSI